MTDTDTDETTEEGGELQETQNSTEETTEEGETTEPDTDPNDH